MDDRGNPLKKAITQLREINGRAPECTSAYEDNLKSIGESRIESDRKLRAIKELRKNSKFN